MHVQKLDPARDVFELEGHKLQTGTSFDLNVPAGHTIEEKEKKKIILNCKDFFL
jgi:hypothetical protein